MPPVTGRVIAGRYNLVDPIGRGAMGVVWRARDSLLDRDVAIKEVFLNGVISDEDRENSYKRTMREARTAARLSHRGVVTVYDVAEDDGRPWIIMELVPSRSLEQVLASDGPQPPRRVCRVGQQLLAALAAAHAAGVLHRDVKPSNVLLADEPDGERAVLTDFGIAQFAGDPRLTQTGMVMGSPGFTAPERIRGGKATPASDLWSLGATLFAAVEGRGPYEERGGVIATMSAIINEDAPPASSAGPLAPLIRALLSRAPAARPTAAAAARMFAGVLPLLPELQAPARRTSTLVSTAVPMQASAGATSQEARPDAPAEPEDAADGAASAGEPAGSEAGDGEPADGGADGAGEDEGAEDDDTASDRQADAGAMAGEAAGAPAPEGTTASDDSADAHDAPQAGAAGMSGPASEESQAPAFSPRAPVTGSAAPETPLAAPSRDWRPAGGAGETAWSAGGIAGPGRPSTEKGGDPPTKPQLPWGPAPLPMPRRGRGALIVAVAVVLAAVIATAAALLPRHGSAATGRTGRTAVSTSSLPDSVKALDSPRAALPAGWVRETVPPSEHGPAAGFSIGVPRGWTVHQEKLVTYLDAPDGVRYVKIDLTRHARTDMLAEAGYVERNGIAQGNLPGYHRDSLQRVTIRGAAGAFWAFTWTTRGGVTMRVDDLLFELPSAAGPRSYAIDFTSPTADFGNAGGLPLFNQILRTFEPVTS